MRKIIHFLVLITILLFTSCTANNDYANSTLKYTKDPNYIYDSNNNIVLCRELPQYGYIDYDMRISDYGVYEDFKEDYTERSKQIESIIKDYRKASDNKDFIITDYQDGVCIVKYNGNNSKLIIPKKLEGKKVIKLGGYITKDSPDSDVSYKYVNPLYEKNVREITISKFVKEISYGFFYSDYFDESKRLEKISVDKDNEFFSSENGVLFDKKHRILLCVPENHSDKDLSIPNGVEVVYDFYSQNTINLKIPSTVKKILSLTSDTYLQNSNNWYCSDYVIENRLTSIAVSEDNADYSSEEGVLYNKTKSEMLIYPPRKTDSYFKVPDTVEKIAWNEADDFKYLTTLSVGKKMKEINLHIYLQSSLKSIKGYKGTIAERYAEDNKLKFVSIN